ncbi:MAG: sodium-dependent transporter [Prevotellaceae bacterium]|nr:sodium-dependent transporter [Candidatus Minthosoma caballi]
MAIKDKNVFASKIGAILAAAGSAVGLGNVWRFPTETGANGGAAFILIYVLFMLVFGVPIMVTEFAIGRHAQSDVSDSFQKMSGGKRAWRLMGLLPVVSGVLVLSYYSVVAGWTLHYVIEALMNGFAGKESAQYTSDFEAFSSDPVQPIIWTVAIIAMTCSIVALGVQRGIERGAKIMMPMLFVFIIVLVGCSLSLPDADKGLAFLLKPDFSKVTSSVCLSAMGQAFFSLSVGIGCLCTYACYFRKDVDLMKDGLSVASIDTMVALFSGFIIFPAVYSIQGLQPDAGPSLVFITLPNVFQQVFGGMPVVAYIASLVFYLLLVMAALTSSISMLEMAAAYFLKNFKMPRLTATLLVSAVCLVLGSFCSLSFGAWKDVTIFGMGFFDLFDFLVAKLMMPIGGTLMCVFLGWVVDEKVLRAEMTNNGTIKSPLYPVYRFIIRYFAPLCIMLIFANELGLFDFLK